MKITIIASSQFVKEMVEYRDKLKALGHEPVLHPHYVAQAAGEMKDLRQRMGREHGAVKREYNYIREHYDEIVGSDAILVLNFDKNGIKNYIGGNCLMELGFAHVNNKKVFLLNPIPDLPYRDEIEATTDVVLDGDLTKIN